MSVDIATNGDITVISYLKWSVSLIFKDGLFTHFDVPRCKQVIRPSDGTVSYDVGRETFINLILTKGLPSVDIGKMNYDQSFGDYASVRLTKSGYEVRDTTIGRNISFRKVFYHLECNS